LVGLALKLSEKQLNTELNEKLNVDTIAAGKVKDKSCLCNKSQAIQKSSTDT